MRPIDEIKAAGYPAVEIVHTCIIPYVGWESDNDAWIARMEDGSLKGFATNHGQLYEWMPREIQSHITALNGCIASMEKAIQILESQQ